MKIDFILDNIARAESDGFLIPKTNPADPDNFAKIAELFIEGGLDGVKGFIRKLQDSDPDCSKYPRFKQYDDISAVSISI